MILKTVWKDLETRHSELGSESHRTDYQSLCELETSSGW